MGADGLLSGLYSDTHVLHALLILHGFAFNLPDD
jgi:hypothetical protein